MRLPAKSRRPPIAGAALFGLLTAWSDRGALRYLAAHPSSPDPLAILGGLIPAAAAAAMAAVAWGIGRSFLAAGRAEGEGLVSEATAFALGAAAVSCALFALGIAGLLRPPVLMAAAAVAAAAAVPGLSAPLGRPLLAAAAARDYWEAAFQAVLAHAFFSGFVRALAPVTDLDALAYHLPLARLYLEAGRMTEIPWMIFAHWPHAASLLYLPAEALGLDPAAALLHWTATAAWIAAVGGAANGWLGRRAAWAVAALLSVQPVVARFMGAPRVESWWALGVFLSFYWLVRAREDSGRRRLVLAGVLAGLAASVKLIGAVDAAALAGVAFFFGARRTGPERAAGAAAFAAAAAALAAPWYAKAWLATGNPVWPLASSLFGGAWRPARVESLFLAFNRWPAGTGLAFALRQGPEFLLIPAALAAFAGAAAPAFLPPLAALAALHGAAVVWNYEAWRYMIPALPAAALAAAWGWERRGRSLLSSALLAVGLAPALSVGCNNALFAVLGARSARRPDASPREVYLGACLDSYAYFRDVDRTLAAGAGRSRVLLFSEGLGGLLRRADYLWGSPVYQGVLSYDDASSPSDLLERLRALGVTHVSVDWDSPDLGWYGERPQRLMRAMLARYSDPVVVAGPRILYRLRARAARPSGAPQRSS